MAGERIGVFIDPFDPIHQGHLSLALQAMETACLDRVIMLPSGERDSKSFSVSAEDRWKMTVTACSQDGRLIPSRAGMEFSDRSDQADVLKRLKKENPGADLFLLLDPPAFADLLHWPRLQKAASLCVFLLIGDDLSSVHEEFHEAKRTLSSRGIKWTELPVSPVPCSSDSVRRCISQGIETPELFLPVQVYCRLKGLYGFSPLEKNADPWLDKLFAALKPHRFAHSLSVVACATRLALIHGLDSNKAMQAALLHDCAKCLPLDTMRAIAEKNGLTDDPAILSSGALLHSAVGAFLAREEYGMRDPEVLEAIAYHNTGHAGMSRLAMCVCLADSIEPTRESYPRLEEIRSMADQSLEKALLCSLESTADFVCSKGKFLHPRTQETISWLKSLPACKPSDPLREESTAVSG